MFTTLHELAKKAPLMITVAAEGDDQLRVNVTPTPTDTKAKHNLPQPLSLLATPTEFDADFIAALSTWQAPKRSLIQQAADAAGGAAKNSAPALPAPKAETKNEAKGDKPGRKARGGKGAEDDKKNDAVPDAAAAAGEATAAADQTMGDTANTDAGGQLQAGAEESVASTSTTVDEEAAHAGEVQAAPTLASGATASAPGEQPGADQAPAGDEPVDKFTLDLF